MAPVSYSEAEKDAALAIFVERGLAAAWRETGIPKPTVARWAQKQGIVTEAPAKMAEARAVAGEQAKTLRAQLRVTLLEKAADLLDRMDAEHVDFKGKDSDEVVYPIAPASAVQNYAVSVGILIDKFRLESGEATGKFETTSLTAGMDDHERQALRAVLDRAIAEATA
ncbi:MAG: hypothetical protein V1912_11390 [bacterium]